MLVDVPVLDKERIPKSDTDEAILMLREPREVAIMVLSILSATLTVAQHSSTVSPDQIWNDLMAGNQRFIAGKSASRDIPAQRKILTETQHPRVAVLSCSDSRVPPELVFDSGLGELFVVRSAGEDDDPLSIGSLEYAVEHLDSSVIVVMGHQRCGAVTAACSGEKPGSVNLDAVESPILPSCTMMDPKRPETLDLAVHDHIHRVAQDLPSKSKIIKKALDEGKLTLIEAYYSLDTGEVTKLR
ncbi:MAG TPA: carbonic anhydrase [Candidatus Binatia bacterium]|nr:carbonic anhydrase [Candidatus Binatia bacterium]